MTSEELKDLMQRKGIGVMRLAKLSGIRHTTVTSHLRGGRELKPGVIEKYQLVLSHLPDIKSK